MIKESYNLLGGGSTVKKARTWNGHIQVELLMKKIQINLRISWLL